MLIKNGNLSPSSGMFQSAFKFISFIFLSLRCGWSKPVFTSSWTNWNYIHLFAGCCWVQRLKWPSQWHRISHSYARRACILLNRQKEYVQFTHWLRVFEQILKWHKARTVIGYHRNGNGNRTLYPPVLCAVCTAACGWSQNGYVDGLPLRWCKQVVRRYRNRTSTCSACIPRHWIVVVRVGRQRVVLSVAGSLCVCA